MEKRCHKCGEVKPLDAFHRDSRSKDDRQGRCKACAIFYASAWNKAHPERRREIDNKRHQKHRSARMAAYRAWLARNPDKKKQYEFTHNSRRRAQANGNGGNHTPAQLLALFESYLSRCVYCLAPATEVDHVVPLSRGGTNDIDNLVPACGPCNRRKFNRSLLAFLSAEAR